jgi:cytochrome P450
MDFAQLMDEFSPFDARLADLDYRNDLYGHARANCPVHRSNALGGFWVVSGYEEIVEVLQDPGTFASGPSVRIPTNPARPTLPPIDSDAPAHRDWRRLLNTFFSPAGLTPHRETIRCIAGDLAESIAEKGQCDLMAEFAEPFSAYITGRVLMGIDDDDRIKEIQRSNHGIAQAHDRAETEANWNRLHAHVEDLYDERVRQPRPDDLVTAITQAEVEGRPVTRDEACSCLMILHLGGLDTVTDAIGSITVRLTEQPDLTELVANPEWMRINLDEFLRLNTPVDHEGRTVTRDVELAGRHLRQGDRVMLMYTCANRDERAFEHADRLDFQRQRNRHLAFGMGPHRCVGSHLARLEIEIGFEELLGRIRDLRITPGDRVTWKVGLSFGPKRVPISYRAQPRR